MKKILLAVLVVLLVLVPITESISMMEWLIKEEMIGTDENGIKTYDVYYHPEKSVTYRATPKGTVLFLCLLIYTEHGKKVKSVPEGASCSIWVFEFDLHGKYRTLLNTFLDEKGKVVGNDMNLNPKLSWDTVKPNSFGQKWEKMCIEFMSIQEVQSRGNWVDC